MVPNGNARRFYLVVVDSVLVNVAVMLALYLRFEGDIPEAHLASHMQAAAPFTCVSIAILAALGLYTRSLRHASVDELLASFTGSSLSGCALWIIMRRWVSPSFPRSVIVIAGVLIFVFVGGARISVRLCIRLGQKAQRFMDRNNDEIRVLVVGAGDAGAILGRELSKPALPRRKVVGYIDDDPRKRGSSIYGAKVLGNRECIPDVIKSNRVHEVIIAMPSAPGHIVQEVMQTCQGLQVKMKVFPHLLNIGETFHLDMIRDIALEDLLGRPEVKIDTARIKASISGKTVLVTGAGGSIGSEICAQVAGFSPRKIILLGHGENSVFQTFRNLRRDFPGVECVTVIADVRDLARIQDVFAAHRPQCVFHAAAHKHVPLMEDSPEEAVKTNVFGTMNVAREALFHKAERFVMISTDKAVNPTSVMGVTKRVGEKVVQLMNTLFEGTVFVSVRFGNVLGSSGSVVPIFKEQISRGGPVTVTHPDMTRYFMTIKEAVLLVLQAGTMGNGGEVFVLDMGKPVKIIDLAEHMIRLSGYAPHVEIPIVYTGVRQGEKLYEEILTAEEGVSATQHSQIYVAMQNLRSVDACLEDLARLEELCFPVDYPLRLFPASNSPPAPGGLRANLWTRAYGEAAAGDASGGLENGDSGLKRGLVLASRREDIIRTLCSMVPSYKADTRTVEEVSFESGIGKGTPGSSVPAGSSGLPGSPGSSGSPG